MRKGKRKIHIFIDRERGKKENERMSVREIIRKRRIRRRKEREREEHNLPKGLSKREESEQCVLDPPPYPGTRKAMQRRDD